ncbi:hypothetical protein PT974_03207 [Cladobotryum mycophilum]|uniref:Zn(2)-C6 fungal-type domain-containing protein n=1 Tax=Cladobotryum mycophilum TaxID=491253 RepID=A0ABR0SRR7_9HYPO
MPNIRQQLSPNPSDSSSNESNDSPPNDRESGTMTRTNQKSKPLSRRGHFKSRLGCFNCKRRRVKCNELRPSCSPCSRLGLSCSYPPPASSPSSSSSSTSPRPSLPTLAFEDLRFYHQFLTGAFPALPLRAADVWMQAAAMSHSYDYLAHAVLGLGASHISQHGNVDYTEQALQHRVTAIKLVNDQIAKAPKNPADADALFATLICLVAQSSLMPDSMIEYLTTTRGANLVATTVITDYQSSIFSCFTMEEHLKSLTKVASDQPKDMTVIDGFRSAVMDLEPLCQNHTEVAYWESLIRCIDSVPISAIDGWKGFVVIFIMPSTFSNEDYSAFIDPENYVAYLLIIHGFLIDYLLGRFCIAPSDEPKYPGRKAVVISWARNLVKTLPPEYRKYMKWALEFCEELEHQDARYLLSP